MTQYLRNLNAIPKTIGRTIITIGSYDGIHLGHQYILSEVVNQARAQHYSSIVVSFDPDPKIFFSGQSLPRLMSWREKFLALSKAGIDYFLTIPFNQSFSEMTAETFVETILVEKLHVKSIIIGDDFRFGKNRKGDEHLLRQLGSLFDFTVHAISTYTHLDQRVSSSRIRQALEAGNLSEASVLLGEPYTIVGKVVHGQQLGRTLGFPTANIDLHRRSLPLHGIYVVRVNGLEGKSYEGVASVGTRPTVSSDSRFFLEVLIFDFNEMIYGQTISVMFLHKLRNEIRYDTLDQLKMAIHEDVIAAEAWFTAQERAA